MAWGLPPLEELVDFGVERGSDQGRLLTMVELHALPPVAWLVKGWIPEGGLAVLFGKAGVGKSFLVLDLAFCVALGRAWFGQVCTKGGVLFVAGEGAGMLCQRTSAWCQAHRLDAASVEGFYFRLSPVNLVEEGSVTDFLDSLAGVALRLIVFDTLARCMPGGDENSARDMGLVIRSLDRIVAVTGAAVLCVHHTGKKSSDERGSSALRGAADTMVSVARAANGGVITVRVDKLKDGAEPKPIRARLVTVGGSCVAKPAGAVAEHDPEAVGGQSWSGSTRNRDVLRTLHGIGDGGATATEWQAAVHAQYGIGEKTFYQAIGELGQEHLVGNPQAGKRNSRYRVTEAGLKALAVNTPLTVKDSDDSDLHSLSSLPPPYGGGGKGKDNSEQRQGLSDAWGTVDEQEDRS